jgi:hypothetical protein
MAARIGRPHAESTSCPAPRRPPIRSASTLASLRLAARLLEVGVEPGAFPENLPPSSGGAALAILRLLHDDPAVASESTLAARILRLTARALTEQEYRV